ncbi:MAG: putative type IV restriction endonuclease [Flavobacteriales bacterium]|jgi:predicted type IV restriction endonuclease
MQKYPSLNFKNTTVQLKKGELIFDSVRKKWLKLTPEEWVRQHLVEYLHVQAGYPKSLMAIESGLKVNNLQKRTDLVLFGANSNKLMLVECKAPSVAINQEVFNQIARYNMTLKVEFLMVTNGLKHYCCKIDFENEKFIFLNDIPTYEQLLST